LEIEKGSHAPWALLVRPEHLKMPGGRRSFMRFVGRARVFNPNPVRKLTINTSIPHLEFLVQNCDSSGGMQLWSFRRVSIFSLIF